MNEYDRALSNLVTIKQKFVFHHSELSDYAREHGIVMSRYWAHIKDTYPKAARGEYDLSKLRVTMAAGRTDSPKPADATVIAESSVADLPMPPRLTLQSLASGDAAIPDSDPYYVPWGSFQDIKSIVASRVFYPTFITGLTGNGKTMMVEQACAAAKRECVRVQISPETDEGDLLGSIVLINGDTVFAKGPVIHAMERGAVLLLDEIDRGSNLIMCLQSVLEGKPVLIKRTGEVVKPAPGFNVIATANTKGQGSTSGNYSAATIIDEAFLERFTITVEQEYPGEAIEKRIVKSTMQKHNCEDESFASNLCAWAKAIRMTFASGAVDAVVSTRRLCHIVQSYAIFGSKEKALKYCVNRFDEATKIAFFTLYSTIDAEFDSSSVKD